MSTVEKSIRLYAWKTNYQTFQVVQGEANSRKFNIQLFSTTIPVDLTNCEVMFYAVKPDSTKVYVECEVIDAENGSASVTLTDQMCVVDGTVDCWVQVIGEGGTDLRFEGMNIEVSPCSMTMSLESSDDMRAFLQQSAKLGALETEVKNARAGEDSLRAKQDAQDTALANTAKDIRQKLGVERTRIDNLVAPGVSAIGFCKKQLFKQSTTKVNTTYQASWTSDGQDDDSVFLSSAKTKNLFVLDCFAVGGIEASDSWERTTHRAEAEITIIKDSVRVQAFYSAEDPEITAVRFYVILGYDEDNAELTDIRVGADGTVYDNAGKAVRQQIEQNTTDINQITGCRRIEFTPGFYIETYSSVANVESPVQSTSGMAYAIVPCVAGDKFTISGKGASYGRLWAFTDASYNVLLRSEINVTSDKLPLTAPKNAAYIILNDKSGSSSYTGEFTQITLAGFESRMAENVNDVQNVKENVLGLSTVEDITFVNQQIYSDGTISSDRGETDPTPARICTPDFIKAITGSTIEVSGDYQFAVAEYTSGVLYSTSPQDYMIRYTTYGTDKYFVSNDCYIRIGLRHNPTAEINPEDARCLTVNAYPSRCFTRNLGLPITDFVGEDYNYNGEYVAQNQDVETLYSLWDELLNAHGTYVTKEVLGRDSSGTYDIVCYTINSHTSEFSKYVVGTKNLTILWLPGVHGTEPHIVYATYKFFKDLLENHFTNDALRMLWNNCTFKVIPCCNPWGLANKSRGNSNGVDINRNFNASWSDEFDTQYNLSPGNAPESEQETKIIVKFIQDNPDAFLAVNAHDSNSVADSKIIGYIASNFVSDNLYGEYSGRKIDSIIKSNPDYYNTLAKLPELLQKNIFGTLISNNVGTMDKWFNTIGVHGFLMELAPYLGNNIFGVVDDDFIQKMNVTVIGVLLSTFVYNNQTILENSDYFKTYSIVDI